MTGIILVFLALAQRVTIGQPSFLPFINKNHYAGYMEILVPMTAALCYANFSKVQTSGGLRNIFLVAASKKNATLFLFYALAGTLFCFTTIMTYSRGGLFGMIFSLLVVLALLAGRNRRWLSFAAVAAILVISVVLINADGGKVFSHVENLADNDSSTVMRYEIWRDTVRMIKKFPYVGVGPGGFETAFPSFKTIDVDANFFQPESDYLYTLAEAGFIGFVLVIAFISIFLWKVLAMHRVRTDRFARSITAGCVAGLAGLLVHGLVDTSLHLPAIMLLMAIFMGIAYVAAGTRFRQGGRSGRILLSRREVVLNRKGKWAISVCAVLSLLISGSALAGSASDLLYRSALNGKKELAARSHAGPEDYLGLIKKLDMASLIDPGRAEYGFEEGRAYLWLADYAAILEKIGVSRPGLEPSRSYNEKALRCFRESAACNPYSSFPHLMAGRVLEHGLGDQKGGETEYRIAEALNPTSLIIKNYLAEYYKSKGDGGLARKYQTAADVTRVH
ncbi:MAG: O-antigen ligase family protein [Nitrospirota bacterium]